MTGVTRGREAVDVNVYQNILIYMEKLIALLVAIQLSSPAALAQQPAAVRVDARPVLESYPAEGVVEAVRSATLAAQTQGRILEMKVDAGDRVRAGEVVVRIDSSEAAQAVAGAVAQVEQARAGAINARAQYERTRGLFEQKFVSQAALDQAEAQLRAAEAALRAAEAGRGQASVARGFASLAAPMDGVVARRDAQPGEMAQPGRALLTIYDPTAMRVVADLPQSRLGALRAASISARVEFPDSGRWVDAASIELIPTADPRTHTVQARVALPSGTAGVLPGMFARVHFATGEQSRIGVPPEAVVRRGEITGVYVQDPQRGFVLRQVRLGEMLADGRIEVLVGLSPDESVAIDAVRAGIALKRPPQAPR